MHSGVRCGQLHLIDGTDLRDGKLHVPFIHWEPLIRLIHPTSYLFFSAPHQFYGWFKDLELMFPKAELPREIELLFREVEGIDLFNRLIPLARAFSECEHDVNCEITFQSGPDFGRGRSITPFNG